MPSYRQRRRCGARRTNGEQCRNFSILGGSVCRVHGGGSPKVREAAGKRLIQRRINAQADAALAAWQKARAAWMADRILLVAELLDITPETVTPLELVRCALRHGRPDPLDPGPDLASFVRLRR